MTFQEYRYLQFPELSPVNNVYYVRIGADTIVNTKTYYKLERTPDSTNLSWDLIGLVRETPAKKIYFKPLLENEKLLFDFSMKLNDALSFYSFTCSNSVNLTAYKIDSIEIQQKYHKRFYMKTLDNNFKTVWIENIGDSLTGIFQSMVICLGGITQRLLCHYSGSNLIYHNTILTVKEINGSINIVEMPFDCKNPLITKIQPIQKNNIFVYPNPVKEILYLNINNNTLKNINIKIWDMNGRLKYHNNYQNWEETINLNLNNLPDGIFILEVINGNRIERYKLLKE